MLTECPSTALYVNQILHMREAQHLMAGLEASLVHNLTSFLLACDPYITFPHDLEINGTTFTLRRDRLLQPDQTRITVYSLCERDQP